MLIAGLLLTLTIACKSKTTAVAEDTMDKAETKRSPRNQNGRQGPVSYTHLTLPTTPYV